MISLLSKKNDKGFSLIELSIVLIIMGLLVAGVTGGTSLIKSVNLRTTIAEIQDIRLAHVAYYNLHGRVAGSVEDRVSIGKINNNNDCNCITWETSMSSNFFKELKEDNLINKDVFQLKYANSNVITSKFNETGEYGNKLVYVPSNDQRSGDLAYNNSYRMKYTGKNLIRLIEGNRNGEVHGAISSENAYLFDEKMDDGKPKTGNVFLSDHHIFGPFPIVMDTYDKNSKIIKGYFLSFVLNI